MSKEKVLILASVASMIDQFNMSNIDILLSLGYEVHVACNFEQGSTCTKEKIDQLKNKLEELDVKYYQIDFTRSVYNIFQDIKAYKQVKKLMIKNKYKFIHCHSPIGGVVGRLVCKNAKTKCIYTAHGFHFYKGAPLKNWIIFYPIEKWLSRYTDILITINKEDYNRAKNKFEMKQLEYIPGVGVDIQKFQLDDFDRDSYRKQLGLDKNDFMILSVGELNANKNHEVVLNAIAKLNNSNIKYMIAGQGGLKQHLLDLAQNLSIENQLQLLGFRNDIAELDNCADLFILPSKREGLGLAAIEAMSTGLPIITSNVHGMNDYSINGISGYSYKSNDINGFAKGIKKILENKNLNEKMSKYNRINSVKYDKKNVEKLMRSIYLKAM